MSIDTASTTMQHLHEILAHLNGALDPATAKRSLAELEREREELRKKIGTIEMAVDLVRDARDQ